MAATRSALYDAGVDVHENDRFGHLTLSHAGISARDEMVIGISGSGRAVATVIGGGYGTDIEEVARHSLVFRPHLL